MEVRRRTLFDRAIFLNNLTRAITPSHLYLFPLRSSLRGNSIIYGVPKGNDRYFFRFHKDDWRFNWQGATNYTAQSFLLRLNSQFELIESGYQSFRPIEGILHPEPLPIYTKILILNRGRYHKTAAVIVNNRTRNLRVQTTYGNVIRVSQDLVELLDPEEILPFGTPICGFPIQN